MVVTGLAVSGAYEANAVTAAKKKKSPFLFDITSFTTKLSLPVQDTVETIKMPLRKMEERLERSVTDPTVEPLSLILGPSESQRYQVAEKIAIVGREDDLAAYLKKAWEKAKPIKKDSPSRTIYIDKEGFDLIDKEAFSDLYSRTHHNLEVMTGALKQDEALRREFLRQLKPFFKKRHLNKLTAKIMRGEPIKVDTELLPEFAAKMVKQYIVYRGPNCFHAALAFQSPKLTSSALVNVKEETGYHRAMINYDELWRILNRSFYEVDPEVHPLKYGDVLVFFEAPDDEAEHWPIDYRWIRHAATYLFGGYTFSKGSKSPNTPYTVRTLSEEWKTWQRFTKNLAIKVYRRSSSRGTKTPPVKLNDWLY